MIKILDFRFVSTAGIVSDLELESVKFARQ
jgi:hypothetical protein